MTERGLPIPDGAPACPFVALEDDREERASSPDPRHRCYAEVRPAPRALAHQDAYCLSSAFAVCPTFQDWARRESARTRDDQARADDDRSPAVERFGGNEPAVRNPQRSWASPPPWLGSFDAGPAGRANAGRDGPDARDEYDPDRPDAGLAGSLAHRIAMDGQPPAASRGGPVPPTRPVRAIDGRSTPNRPRRDPDDGGPQVGRAYEATGEDEADDVSPYARRDDVPAGPPPVPPSKPAAPGGTGAGDARFGGLLPRGRPSVSQARVKPRRDAAGPSWERPARYEAYPMLKTRMGMGGVPRVVLGFVALLLAAAALFALPGLLGIGGPGASPTPAVSASRSPAPSASTGPIVTPGPTSVTYLVQPGDTMSKIAARFSVPLPALIEANKDKYPNPDKIVAGDSLIIPSALPSTFKDATQPTKAPTKAP